MATVLRGLWWDVICAGHLRRMDFTVPAAAHMQIDKLAELYDELHRLAPEGAG